MQVNAMLSALFAVAASGAAIESRQAVVTYDVSGFSANCIPHSVQCG